MQWRQHPVCCDAVSVEDRIRVNEIFCSLQGESTFAGLPCVFVRTTGCPLRCAYCDTRHAYSEGRDLTTSRILEQALSHDVPLVEVTGGEPLAQAAVHGLIGALCDAGRTVLVETSGHLDIAPVDRRAHVIMDIKCPSSGMTNRMRWDNIEHLDARDEVKLVLANADDYAFARRVIREHDLAGRCAVLLSTVWGALDPARVAEWMVRDRLPARLQVQLHKLLWGPDARGV